MVAEGEAEYEQPSSIVETKVLLCQMSVSTTDGGDVDGDIEDLVEIRRT